MKKVLLAFFYLCIAVFFTISYLVSTRVNIAHFVMSKVWEPPRYIEITLDKLFPSKYVAISIEKDISRSNLIGQINFWRSIPNVNKFGILGVDGSYVIISKFSPYSTKEGYKDLIEVGCKVKLSHVEVNKLSLKEDIYIFIPYKNPEYVIFYNKTHKPEALAWIAKQRKI